MLEYDRIDLSEGIDVNKTSNSRECSFCHYYYFLDINFNYRSNFIVILIIKYLCDGCHDMSIKANRMQNLAIVYFKGNAYRIHFWNMSKDDATNIMHNSNLIDKKGALQFFYIK